MSGFETLSLPALLILWAVVCTIIAWRALRPGSSGLVLAFVAILSLLHIPGATVHVLPWNPFGGWTDQVHVGTAVSVFGLVFFAIGYLLWGVRLPTVVRSPSFSLGWPDRFIRLLFSAGVASYLLLFTSVSGVPSAGSILSTGQQLLVVGLCILLWHYHAGGERRRYWMALATLPVFPLVTVLNQGFLGYGMVMALTVCCFAVSVYRPQRHMLLVCVAIGYGGLMLYGGYMANRDILRETIWGGGAFDERIAEVGLTLGGIKPLDLHDETLLESFDKRLNQSYLVGQAVEYTGYTGRYAEGETLWMSVIALVPRVLWPDKPVQAGSMGVADRYTGLTTAEGTSVGLGLVLELYINFRWAGVAAGFFLFGVVVGKLDRRAGELLRGGDVTGFVRSFLPGMALLNVGGSFVEMTVSVAAGWLIGVALTAYFRRSQRSDVPMTARAHPA